MASANAIGTGSVILTANADQMTSGLDKAAAKVDSWGKRVQASADKVGKGRLGMLGGEGANKLTEATRAIIPATLTAIATGAVTAVATAVAKVEELNDALERTKQLGEQSVAAFAKASGAGLAGAAQFSNPEHRAEALRDALADAEKDLHSLERQKGQADRRAQGHSLFRNEAATAESVRLLAHIPILGIGAKAALDAAKTEAEELAKRLGTSAEAVKALKAELDKLTPNAVGKAQMDIDRQRFEEMSKGVADTTKSLKEQAATFGMSAGQVAVWKAEQAGASGVMLAGLRAAADELDRVNARAENVKKAFRAAFNSDKLPTERKLGAAMESGSAAAFSAIVKHSVSGMDSPGERAKKMSDAIDRGNTLAQQTLDLLRERLAFDVI